MKILIESPLNIVVNPEEKNYLHTADVLALVYVFRGQEVPKEIQDFLTKSEDIKRTSEISDFLSSWQEKIDNGFARTERKVEVKRLASILAQAEKISEDEFSRRRMQLVVLAADVLDAEL